MTTRRIGALAVAALVAALVGGAAGAFADTGERLLTALVFAACVAPVGYALGWAVLLAPAEDLTSHAADDVERVWMERATSAAFLDVVTVLGITTAVVAVLGVDDVAPSTLLSLVLVGAMADAAVRYAASARLAR